MIDSPNNMELSAESTARGSVRLGHFTDGTLYEGAAEHILGAPEKLMSRSIGQRWAGCFASGTLQDRSQRHPLGHSHTGALPVVTLLSTHRSFILYMGAPADLEGWAPQCSLMSSSN